MIMTYSKKDLKYVIGLMLIMFVVVLHLIAGYVVPIAALLVIAISFVTAYKMSHNWFLISWVVVVTVSYVVTDIVTYSPNGISAMLYKYMLSILLAQLYGILLCFACTKSKHRAYKDTTMNTDEKVKKIKATLSLFSFYAVIVSGIITITSMLNTFSKDNNLGVTYLSSAMIFLVTIACLNIATYMDTQVLLRAIENSGKKEDDKNEVLEEGSNGESVGQVDEGRTDN